MTKEFEGDISIHALRGEGDASKILLELAKRDFNPRPPWGGRHVNEEKSFVEYLNFNPRPPWGGRRGCRIHAVRRYSISIHALRGEGDELSASLAYAALPFQSTPSVGRATFFRYQASQNILISIHALRGEGDSSNIRTATQFKLISIHALRGEGD